MTVNINSGDKRAAKPVANTTRLPAGFRRLCDIPADVGGGCICEAPVARLRAMCPGWNPSGRTDPASLVTLRRSIEGHGLNQFPVVNATEVVDGNRRIAAAFLAGIKRMPVLFRPRATAGTYAEVNQESRKHTPTQKQETWKENKTAVTSTFHRKMEAAVEVLGKSLVEFVIAEKLSVLSCLSFARRALLFCRPADEPRVFLRNAVMVQVLHSDTFALRAWMEGNKSSVELADRIRACRTLKG